MARHSEKWAWVLLGAGILLCAALGIWWNSRPETRYDEHIRMAAKRYNLDPALIKAVIWRESRFTANARGKAGEIGLMQIREEAAFEWADAEKMFRFHHEEIRDPEKNILCGAFYLAKLLKRYRQADDPLPYALADYNAGRTHVLRWNKGAAQTNSALFLEQIDFPGTRLYAASVISRYKRYQRQFR